MLPERIGRLDELANNLWWSWHNQARQLFRALDYPLWRKSNHNPVSQLHEVNPNTLQAAAADASFIALYDSVMTDFDADMAASNTWFATNHPDLISGSIAYFSMEYAIHNSLPIYAGGLGILAGDICKEASDLGLPLVGVGFMYPQGYFLQRITAGGRQEEIYRGLDFNEVPINSCPWPQGCGPLVQIQLGDRPLQIKVWLVRVGRVNLYLLDTHVEANMPIDRQLSNRLYIADREHRLQQEIVLGIGGVRTLRALGINPKVWHANEGHTAFMMLERIREGVAEGASFAEALGHVQATTVFTTHTPVLAGHDVFSAELVEKYFSSYWQSLGIDRETFFQLGRQDGWDTEAFNMTALALRTAGQRCAVSQLHGKVTRRMWHGLWPEVAEDQVPISHVTNGIHVPTWVAPELDNLFKKYLGSDWVAQHDNTSLWYHILDIPDGELWSFRQILKRKLVGAIRERMRNRWVADNVPWTQIMAMGALLDPEALTIAFTRRFTEYKRPALLFTDIERLKRILNDPLRPVQVIFAGKSHPADLASKSLLQRVYTLASSRDFQGRIVFVEDYDMHIARYLVHGVDVWLNTPRRLQEACGTSGMKAALNGVIQLSVSDGWWQEGYNGKNGWVLGGDAGTFNPETEDETDAEALYRLLEEEIVPLYYTRDRSGVPLRWISLVKEVIRTIVPVFCARRMLKEYTERMYKPAAQPPELA